MAYLIELRKRLLKSLIFLTIVFVILCYFSKQLYGLLTFLLLKYLPHKMLIATGITSTFLIPFKLSFLIAIFLTIPFLLCQLWTFIVPALYKHERKIAWILLILSTLLFYSGILFAYFFILPWMLNFFLQTSLPNVAVIPDISQFFDFTFKLLLLFGLAFEVPILTCVLLWTGTVTMEQLRQKRRYIIVSAFIIGMLLTPPDVISQILVAIPLCLLFELGLLIAKIIPIKNYSVSMRTK